MEFLVGSSSLQQPVLNALFFLTFIEKYQFNRQKRA